MKWINCPHFAACLACMKSYEPNVNWSMFDSCECMQLYSHLGLCSSQCCRFTAEESTGLPAGGAAGWLCWFASHRCSCRLEQSVEAQCVDCCFVVPSLQCWVEHWTACRGAVCCLLLYEHLSGASSQEEPYALLFSSSFFSSCKNLKQNDCYISLIFYLFIHPYTSLQNHFIPSPTGECGSTLC